MAGRAIAMWSGPRNISTAMMRAWENRNDTRVIDEPFYAHYLHHTGIDHPMTEEIIAQGQTDWQSVVRQISAIPSDHILYQKHITTHWLDHYSTDWLDELTHVFLIRCPEKVVASYANKHESITIDDLGYEKQAALFDLIAAKQGTPPMVLDSDRFLADPESQLKTLCQKIGIAFKAQMLSWPAGSRDSDGIWGQHWYDSVNRSTGFGPPNSEVPALPPELQTIAVHCRPYYEKLAALAL